MRLDFSNLQQLETFAAALCLGAAFFLLYCTVCFFVHPKNPVLLFFRDIFCFSAAGVMSFFFFLLYCKGVLRFYVFAGEIVGVIAARFTVAVPYRFLLRIVLEFTRFLAHRVIAPAVSTVNCSITRHLSGVKNRFKGLFLILYLRTRGKKSDTDTADRVKNAKKFGKKSKKHKKALERYTQDVV